MFRIKLIISVALLIISIGITTCDNSTKSSNILPVCSITYPVNDTEIECGDTVTIEIEATDEDGEIVKIKFLIDNITKYTTSELPYTFDWETDNVEVGEHTITVTAEDNDEEISSDEIVITVKDDYTPPSACFTFSVGQDFTVTFDATCCYDNEDAAEDLEVRWDWDGDGNWDTDFDSEKSMTHQYNDRGTYNIVLKVRDTYGDTDIESADIKVLDGTVTDIDGNIYNTIIINGKEWMAENLKVTRYNNGISIPKVTNNTEWNLLTTGAYCAYNNEECKADSFGYLYNWYAANGNNNLAPEGWHVATEVDYEELAEFISDDNGGYTKYYYDDEYNGWNSVGRHLKSKELWMSGSDTYYFAALPGGYRNKNGISYGYGATVHFWPDTTGLNELGLRHIRFRSLGEYTNKFGSVTTNSKAHGRYIRCVKD